MGFRPGSWFSSRMISAIRPAPSRVSFTLHHTEAIGLRPSFDLRMTLHPDPVPSGAMVADRFFYRSSSRPFGRRQGRRNVECRYEQDRRPCTKLVRRSTWRAHTHTRNSHRNSMRPDARTCRNAARRPGLPAATAAFSILTYGAWRRRPVALSRSPTRRERERESFKAGISSRFRVPDARRQSSASAAFRTTVRSGSKC